jgi:fluoroacetyl-CoA thioesterase
MRHIAIGHQEVLSIVVSEAMTVHFEQMGKVHPVYATYELAKHFEELGRKILVSHLEYDEEGVGTALSVEHLASALVGMRVDMVGTVTEVTGRRLVCTMVAHNELGDCLGRGTTTQLVLPRARLEAGFGELQARWREASAILSP